MLHEPTSSRSGLYISPCVLQLGNMAPSIGQTPEEFVPKSNSFIGRRYADKPISTSIFSNENDRAKTNAEARTDLYRVRVLHKEREVSNLEQADPFMGFDLESEVESCEDIGMSRVGLVCGVCGVCRVLAIVARHILKKTWATLRRKI